MEGRRRKTAEEGADSRESKGTQINMTHSTYSIKPPETSEIGSISLLMFLYVLQGIPLGLSASIPMILQNKGVSYKDQATFSLAIWPFSVKLLWAPLVDSVYWSSMGRRKSWLVPAQYLIGVFMLLFSMNIDTLLGEETSTVPPNVVLLTFIFFALNFLAATQDIAVDGWALTILSRQRVGWASTCNSVGQTAGFFLGYVVFLALESNDFCVNYLGLEGSVVDLKGYFYFWGIVFLVTTTLVWALKSESEFGTQSAEDSEEINLSLTGTYKMLFKIINKPNIRTCIAVLFTCKIGFAAADSLTVLKMTEAGVPKDKLALLSIPLTPIQIFLPFIVSRYTAGPKPMEVCIKAIPYRLLFSLMFAGVVYLTPSFKDENGVYPSHFYVFLVFVYILHQISANCMFVSVMAFFARISDPAVGGTYMTLLNTFFNMGGNWPTWVALRYVSDLTWSTCEGLKSGLKVDTCDSSEDRDMCLNAEGSCLTSIDGYYVESIICFCLGAIWLFWGVPTIRYLGSLSLEDWRVVDIKQKIKK